MEKAEGLVHNLACMLVELRWLRVARQREEVGMNRDMPWRGRKMKEVADYFVVRSH